MPFLSLSALIWLSLGYNCSCWSGCILRIMFKENKKSIYTITFLPILFVISRRDSFPCNDDLIFSVIKNVSSTFFKSNKQCYKKRKYLTFFFLRIHLVMMRGRQILRCWVNIPFHYFFILFFTIIFFFLYSSFFYWYRLLFSLMNVTKILGLYIFQKIVEEFNLFFYLIFR